VALELARKPDTLPDAQVGAEAKPKPTPNLGARVHTWKAPPRMRRVVPFAIGLLLGWLLLGWILFPVHWTDTDPWDMRADYQQRYVQMLANVYWQTQDVAFVKASVEGWDRAKLGDLIGQMMTSADQTPESRQQLLALNEVLALQMPEESLLASLLRGSKAIIITGLLAIIPLFAAVGLVMVPLLRRASGTVQTRADVLEEAAAGAGGGSLTQDEIFTDQYTEEKEEEEKEKEEKPSLLGSETGSDQEIGDLLSAFLDEDEQGLEQLQALAKGLTEVRIDDLLSLATNMARDLARINRLPRKHLAA
jgi:hypothetical protein